MTEDRPFFDRAYEIAEAHCDGMAYSTDDIDILARVIEAAMMEAKFVPTPEPCLPSGLVEIADALALIRSLANSGNVDKGDMDKLNRLLEDTANRVNPILAEDLNKLIVDVFDKPVTISNLRELHSAVSRIEARVKGVYNG